MYTNEIYCHFIDSGDKQEEILRLVGSNVSFLQQIPGPQNVSTPKNVGENQATQESRTFLLNLRKTDICRDFEVRLRFLAVISLQKLKTRSETGAATMSWHNGARAGYTGSAVSQ